MTSVVIASLAAVVAVQDAQPTTSRPSSAPTAVATASAVRAEQPPRIDDHTDDAVWQTAPRFSGFRTFEPRVDLEPAQKTEFQAAFDEKNLYVLVRMFDAHPDSIMHALTRRDQRGPSDQIKILIDSYDDKRSGFTFAVNPDGEIGRASCREGEGEAEGRV